MTTHVNDGFALAITPPEEGAGAAYDPVNILLATCGISAVNLPMDMGERVKTNGKAVDDASAAVRENENFIYVKGPGITPTDAQVLDTIIALEKAGALKFNDHELDTKVTALRTQIKPALSENAMVDFAYAIGGSVAELEYRGRKLAPLKGLIKPIISPNAKWRDALQANLARGTSDKLAERSNKQPADWNADTPFEIYAYTAKPEDAKTVKLDGAHTVKLVFVSDATGTEEAIPGEHQLSDQSNIKLFAMHDAAIRQWVQETLAQIPAGTELLNGTKSTVLKTADVALLGMMSDEVRNAGREKDIPQEYQKTDGIGKVSFSGKLVDDVFARLSSYAPPKPTALLVPNPSYSAYVKRTWDLIKEKGGFRPPKNSEVIRASATGDEYIDYSKTEYKAKESGTLKLVDETGKELTSVHLEAGDVTKLLHFDRQRVKNLVRQALESAKSSGRTNVLLGFDDDDYYRSAIEECDKIKDSYPELTIKAMNSADATAEYFTGGIKDTTLVLSNIRGDFATDIEPYGKGTSYSTGVIYDGRKVVELGSGGTAPDLLMDPKDPEKGMRSTGLLIFNPMSFVEGISLAVRYAGETMNTKGSDATLAFAVSEAIEDGMYATLDKGLRVPAIKNAFKASEGANITMVSTATFVKSVELEAMRVLLNEHGSICADIGTNGGISEATVAKAQKELEKMIAIDTAMYSLENDEARKKQWHAANRTYNEAREKTGAVNPLKPDYTIPLPDADNTQYTAANLLNLQNARAELVQAMQGTGGNKDIAKGSYKTVLTKNFGVGPQEAERFLQADINRITVPSNGASLAAATG